MTKFKRLLSHPVTPGALLLLSALCAMFAANSPWFAPLYNYLLEVPVELRLGSIEFKKNVLLVVNDGLMALFFLLVGLEIKREIAVGELSRRERLMLPLIAASGGVACPALIYLLFNAADPVAQHGWAIPSATDIAFSLGVLSLIGTRVPPSLKIFLTAIAVIDDLAAILIIALFYSGKLSFLALMLGGIGMVLLFAFNRLGVKRLSLYMIVGVVMWACVLKSGVHATMAGVVLGIAIPMDRSKNGGADSPLHMLEHSLRPWVTFCILPLFAFANSGVSFSGVGLSSVVSPISLGIAFGLLVGKPVGIVGATLLAGRLGLAELPVSFRALLGIGLVAGIGFTMSLFIGGLAFEHQVGDFSASVRLGVFGGSILAGLAGLLVLRREFCSAQR